MTIHGHTTVDKNFGLNADLPSRSVGAKLCARLSNSITAQEGEETFKSTLIRR